MFMVVSKEMVDFGDLWYSLKVNTKRVITEQYRFFVTYSGKAQP